MSLAHRLAARIATHGPIGIDAWMEACLHDPQDGYYARRPVLGPRGDFLTSPLTSQMFGELLGLWAIEAWRCLGAPPRVILAELGPGDGTMIVDVLRAARTSPAFDQAADLWLVDRSAPFRRSQAAALDGRTARWADDAAGLPDDAPLIILANEFLDCLPIRQAVRRVGGWRERGVGLNNDGGFAFVDLEPVREGFRPGPPRAPEGSVFEWSPALETFGTWIGARVVAQGGAALFVDYGRPGPDLGDTLQAIGAHCRRHPLLEPGQLDLTAHVDFPSFLAAGDRAGAQAAPLRTQGDFLSHLGIAVRADALARSRPDLTGRLGRQMARLIGPDQMGMLFKVACLHSGLTLPGFDGVG